MSSNPPPVVTKTKLVRKATGNHLIKPTSLEKNSEPCLWFLLRSKSSMSFSFLQSSQQFRNSSTRYHFNCSMMSVAVCHSNHSNHCYKGIILMNLSNSIDHHHQGECKINSLSLLTCCQKAGDKSIFLCLMNAKSSCKANLELLLTKSTIKQENKSIFGQSTTIRKLSHYLRLVFLFGQFFPFSGTDKQELKWS